MDNYVLLCRVQAGRSVARARGHWFAARVLDRMARRLVREVW